MFNCLRDCTDADGAWNDAKRSARACTLVGPGMPRVEAQPQLNALFEPGANGTPYMGRPADRRLDGVVYLNVLPVDWQHPVEDPAHGCPGAAYRSRWVDSLAPYLRRRTDTGDRVQNHLLDSCNDRLIWEAVQYFEQEEERCVAYIEAAQAKRDAERTKKATANQAPAPRPGGRRMPVRR